MAEQKLDWKWIESAPKAIQDAAAEIQWLGRWRAQVIGAIDGLYLIYYQQPGDHVWYAKVIGPQGY